MCWMIYLLHYILNDKFQLRWTMCQIKSDILMQIAPSCGQFAFWLNSWTSRGKKKKFNLQLKFKDLLFFTIPPTNLVQLLSNLVQKIFIFGYSIITLTSENFSCNENYVFLWNSEVASSHHWTVFPKSPFSKQCLILDHGSGQTTSAKILKDFREF